jgi:hypothetical protein
MQGEEETSLAESYLVYDWLDSDTSHPGDYLFEFKVTKMNPETQVIEWTRKYPAEKEGISVKILDGNLEV